MNSFYGGGWEPRANTDRANTAPASYRAEGLKPNAPTASTFHGSQSGANPPPNLPIPAGCLLSEGERYAFNEMMDGRYPSDDMEYVR